jgi:hypothetical protein
MSKPKNKERVSKPKNKEGWARPLLANKFHYFTLDGRSLCSRWLMYPTEVDEDTDPTVCTRDSCRTCWKKLLKLETGIKV